MRGLIIFCIISLTAAAPQDYTYSRSPELVGSSQDATQSVESERQYPIDSPLIEGTLSALTFPTKQEHHPFPTYEAVPQNKHNEVLVSKKFFIHSAPDEENDEVQEKVLTVGQHKKNYNVVFIRAPSKSQKATTIRVIPAVKEEKTVVYVLSKKDEPLDINAHVEETRTTTAKPEVYFIKYKTPEEASHAQEKIQAEYERLGGSTQIVNEGLSPVSSVIGSLQVKTTPQESSFVAPSSAPASASAEEFFEIPVNNNSYLPPNFYY